MEEILVISDVHGRGCELKTIIQKLYKRLDKFKFILMGDYIGYGRNNLEVIKMIQFLRKNSNCVVLKGNWEDMFFSVINHSDSEDASIQSKIKAFEKRGGLSAKYELMRNKKVLDTYLRLIEEMPLFNIEKINNIPYVFAHSGINILRLLEDRSIKTFDDLLSKQTEPELIWNFDFFKSCLLYSDLVEAIPFKIVAGHTPVQILNGTGEIKLYNLMDKIYGVDFGASRKSGKLGVVNFSKPNPISYTEDLIF